MLLNVSKDVSLLAGDMWPREKSANELHGRKQHHYSAQMAIFATCPRLYIEKMYQLCPYMVIPWCEAGGLRAACQLFFFLPNQTLYVIFSTEWILWFISSGAADDVHFLSGSELSIVKGYLSRYNVIKRTEKRCLRFYGVNGVDLLDPGVAEIGSKNNALRFVMMWNVFLSYYFMSE